MAYMIVAFGIIGALLLFWSIICGIRLSARYSGKLRSSIIFLTIGLLVFFISQIGFIISITGYAVEAENVYINVLKSELVLGIFNFITILFVFFSFNYMNKMVNDLDNLYNKRSFY